MKVTWFLYQIYLVRCALIKIYIYVYPRKIYLYIYQNYIEISHIQLANGLIIYQFGNNKNNYKLKHEKIKSVTKIQQYQNLQQAISNIVKGMQLNSNLYMGSHQNVPYYATRPASQPSSINPGQSQIRFVNNNAVSQIYYTNPHELSRRKPGESLINKYYPMETIHYSFVNDKFRTSYITSQKLDEPYTQNKFKSERNTMQPSDPYEMQIVEDQKCGICSMVVNKNNFSAHLQFHKNRINDYKIYKIPDFNAIHNTKLQRKTNGQLKSELINVVLNSQFVNKKIKEREQQQKQRIIKEMQKRQAQIKMQQLQDNIAQESLAPRQFILSEQFPKQINYYKSTLDANSPGKQLKNGKRKTKQQKKKSLRLYSNINQLAFTYYNPKRTNIVLANQNKQQKLLC